MPRLLAGVTLRHGMTECAARRLRVNATAGETLAPVIDGEQLPGFVHVEVTPGPAVGIPQL